MKLKDAIIDPTLKVFSHKLLFLDLKLMHVPLKFRFLSLHKLWGGVLISQILINISAWNCMVNLKLEKKKSVEFGKPRPIHLQLKRVFRETESVFY